MCGIDVSERKLYCTPVCRQKAYRERRKTREEAAALVAALEQGASPESLAAPSGQSEEPAEPLPVAEEEVPLPSGFLGPTKGTKAGEL